ncbi:hypothetical protein AMAG_14816 [Allomyces macrogynus ATCC 38327]|uniref:Uncharacterized protein n=1 Tax=Allomyces macrogynus (strain ATCC 38327) TaxID=578462 RepID=A0A0L0T5H3_ALLM3|nr:hypothetical protein AMAG_14816 [Allomyces macrogynus ATCC 38327]|eukprot:KNE69980.1 hypothetical protein AMAG_14816 [Allomyces macrogynus ATCC 38327]
MPATAVISHEPVVAAHVVAPKDVDFATHVATLQSAKNDDKVDKDALAKLLVVIAEQSKDVVSCDLVLAHLVLLAAFHQQLRDAENEAKDLAFLCAAEARYLAFMSALGKAIAKDASLIENPPLPPLDVAMMWHSHALSPIRYADDMQRLYGPDMIQVAFPMMRLSKVTTGTNQEDLGAGRTFWAAHMPADMPYDLAVADVDETAVKSKIACASCRAEQTLAMPEYAAFRLHGKEHTCTSCAAAFTAEHLAVRRFLAKVARASRLGMVAGTLQHPKTLEFVPKNGANMADLMKLFDKAVWKQHVATLPSLPTWADVEAKVLAPIMTATADSLMLPGNRRRFALVVNAHRDVTTGAWSMDLVRAVRRQRRFSKNMTEHVVHRGCGAIHATMTEALVQYPKFLAMMAIRPTYALVPTMSIDLAWHTHQLTPAMYATHTRALTGQIANHDDSDDVETEAAIADGAKAMPDAWRAVFDEDYYRLNMHAGCFLKSPSLSAATTVKDAQCFFNRCGFMQSTVKDAQCFFNRCGYAQSTVKDAQCFLKPPCLFAATAVKNAQCFLKPPCLFAATAVKNAQCFLKPPCLFAATANDTAAAGKTTHAESGQYCAFSHCFIGTHCVLAATDKTANEAAQCFCNGKCMVGLNRPNDAQSTMVANCHFWGTCQWATHVELMDGDAAKVAACFRNGNCMVGPIRPNDAKTTEAAACFRSGNCIVRP